MGPLSTHSRSTHSSGFFTWWQARSDSVFCSPGPTSIFSKLCATRLFFFFLVFYLPLPMSTYFCLASVVGLVQEIISWPSLVETDLSFITAWILSSVKFPAPQSGTEYFSVYSLPTSNQSLWPGGGKVSCPSPRGRHVLLLSYCRSRLLCQSSRVSQLAPTELHHTLWT